MKKGKKGTTGMKGKTVREKKQLLIVTNSKGEGAKGGESAILRTAGVITSIKSRRANNNVKSVRVGNVAVAVNNGKENLVPNSTRHRKANTKIDKLPKE